MKTYEINATVKVEAKNEYLALLKVEQMIDDYYSKYVETTPIVNVLVHHHINCPCGRCKVTERVGRKEILGVKHHE